jgi:hypothetical protein
MSKSSRFLTLFFLLLAVSARAEVIEVPVEAALTPPKGFDDNDNVQIVLHGMLPNTCYEVGEHVVDKAGGVMKIRQFAKRSSNAFCNQGGFIPEFMLAQVPFTNELSLGQLPAGEYQFEFNRDGAGATRRGLSVARSPVSTTDSLPYAAVTNAVVEDLLPAGQDLAVRLHGVLSSTCAQLDPSPRVERMGDVTVVLPTIRARQGVLCAQLVRPFILDVALGKREPGHHLIHVRSMSGRSVNRVVEVQADPARR